MLSTAVSVKPIKMLNFQASGASETSYAPSQLTTTPAAAESSHTPSQLTY